VREASGLAMSSRNVYLQNEQREVALCLHEAIQMTKKAFKEGDFQALSLLKKAEEILAKKSSFALDYMQIVDDTSLEVVTGEISRPARLLLAGYLGQSPRIRLIDNSRIN
jgi:pantothenate synthetase